MGNYYLRLEAQWRDGRGRSHAYQWEGFTLGDTWSRAFDRACDGIASHLGKVYGRDNVRSLVVCDLEDSLGVDDEPPF